MLKNVIVSASLVFCFYGESMNVDQLRQKFQENKLSENYKTVWITPTDARQWSTDAYQGNCVDEHTTVEQKIDSCLTQTVDYYKNKTLESELIAVLWTAYNALAPFNSVASFACISAIISAIKKTKTQVSNFDIAAAILFSQSREGSLENEFIDNYDNALVVSAINMLKSEKNGHKEQAVKILEKIKQMECIPEFIKVYIS